MSVLQTIPVRLESRQAHSVGDLRALLAEIAMHLERLFEDGIGGGIDLKSLPFAPGEYEKLREMLGAGEVSARIEAQGLSEVVETRYPGVWWVTHCNVAGDVIAEAIEIARVPEILASSPEDIGAGLAQLCAQLNERARP